MPKHACRALTWFIATILVVPLTFAQDDDSAISSEVSRTNAGEYILEQRVVINAPVSDVWDAYTTDEGWMAWAAPRAQVDLRVGGTILTAYTGEIGGPQTNTLRIINYVPNELLTLRADVSQNWPEVMQQDGENLSNVILFDEVEPGKTQITSYGMGYGDSPEYDQLMQFFIQANEGLYRGLIRYLEEGEAVVWE